MPLKSQKANFIIFGPNFGYLSPEEEMFYTKLCSVLDQCPRHDALIAQGDFNAVTGTERAGAMKYVLVPMVLVPGMTTALSF